MKTNKDLIRMHLEEWLTVTNQTGLATWHDALAFCYGYYSFVDMDIIDAVADMVIEGKLKEVRE